MLKRFKKVISLVAIMALVFTMTIPSVSVASAESKSSTSSLKAPKITSAEADGNKVTIKWSKVNGAEKYKVYRRVLKEEWKYLKTVKKTSKNKKKYSDKTVYKLKTKGKKYKVYKKSSKKVWKRLKTLKSRKYTFKGNFNTNYTFAVKAVKGKQTSKYSKSVKVKTLRKCQAGPDEEDTDDDRINEDDPTPYIDYLQGEGEKTGKNIRTAALDLYKELALQDLKDGKSNMVSPVSFLTAMALLENGAKGDSLEEIEKAFGIKIDDFNTWYDNWQNYTRINGGEALKLANSVWFRNNDEHLFETPGYRERVRDLYDLDFYYEPFDDSTVNKVNNWAKDKTDGMIPAIIDRLTEDNMMILMNATCFNGAWAQEYNDDQVNNGEKFFKEDGTEETATMLYSTDDEGRFFENDYLTGSFKSYKDGYKIMFLLPKEGYTVSDVMNKLEGDEIHKLDQNAERAEVDLTIPEFSFDYSAPDAIKSLENMGIHSVFDYEKADLSGIATRDDEYNLVVGDIVHKTHIQLDREGTKAAAVTEIGIVKANAAMDPLPKKELRLDRPFIFVIADTMTDTPIFMGTVMSVQE